MEPQGFLDIQAVTTLLHDGISPEQSCTYMHALHVTTPNPVLQTAMLKLISRCAVAS